ncbi:hypothetical protein AB0230_04020 [Microbacterium sp. NPDC089190]|uniref:arsenate reductase/protein-tyrosine-phosphatase family protein n=1 Tax=Microbacterium sp. NPDC089190 TaxID=3155063 RepID=UPI00344EA495
MTVSADRVVIVCTANVIRSAFVAALLSSRSPEGHKAHLTFQSAGTLARPSTPADEKVVTLGRTYGLSLEGHRARRLDEGFLRTGDTVLCAERAHRRVVLDLRPDLISSVFTIREFSRLVETVPGRAPSWAALVQAASRSRLSRPPRDPEEDDMLDPVGGADAAWLAFERQATQAVSSILAALTALPTPSDTGPSVARPLSRREYRHARENALRVAGSSERS